MPYIRKTSLAHRKAGGAYLRRYCDSLLPGVGNRGLTKIANLLQVSLSIVSLWCSGHRRIPVYRAVQLVRASDGVLKMRRLRPDLDWDLVDL